MVMKVKLAGRKFEFKTNGWRGLVSVAGMGLLAAAVARELALPAAERTWHGQLFGVVPYELRLPTLGRLQATFWNPSNPRVIVPTLFGVGWTINLGAIRAMIAPAE